MIRDFIEESKHQRIEASFMNIKICGIRTPEMALAAVDAGASHIGLVFFKRSPRNLTPSKAAEIAYLVDGKAKIVIVTVDPTDQLLSDINSLFIPDYIQLHGAETVDRVLEIKREFGLKIIKAIPIKTSADLAVAEKYKNIADYIMLDAKPCSEDDMPGGNARSFDWNIVKDFSPDYRWILSGGLNPNNVNQAKKLTNASFLDVSSGVESSPGNKQIPLIKQFIANANAA